jgi:hypothetical protein
MCCGFEVEARADRKMRQAVAWAFFGVTDRSPPRTFHFKARSHCTITAPGGQLGFGLKTSIQASHAWGCRVCKPFVVIECLHNGRYSNCTVSLGAAWFVAIFNGANFSNEILKMPVFSVEVASLSGDTPRDTLRWASRHAR